MQNSHNTQFPKVSKTTRSLCQYAVVWGSLLVSSPGWATSPREPLSLPTSGGAANLTQRNQFCTRESEQVTQPPLSLPLTEAGTKVASPAPSPSPAKANACNGPTKTPLPLMPGAKVASGATPGQSQSTPRAGSFKANLVRPARFYKASTLVNLEPARLENSIDLSVAPEFRVAAEKSLQLENQVELIQNNPTLRNLQAQTPAPNITEPGNVTPNQLPCPNFDVDLGCLRIDGWVPPPAPPPKSVFLIFRTDYFRSSNVFSGVDPIDDGLFRPGVTLFAAPRLGPSTFLIASANGNLIRYSTESRFNYNELAFEVGIFQQLSPNMSLKFGWANQQLFIASDDLRGFSKGQRFLDDHGIRIELSRRDQLGKRFALTTYYQFRLGFADPADRSRVINSLITSLTYDIQPSILQLGLDYQFALATFTQQKREDQYQQIGLRLTYTAFRTTQINLFAGYSFGRSSDRLVDFSGLVLGITLGANLALF